MTAEDLHQLLASKFEILAFVDLAEINQSHSAAYKLFNQHYRTEYTPNQRLVLYSQHQPSVLLIQHLQNASKLIDISNCFILICAPDEVNSDFEYFKADVISLPLADDRLLDEKTLCPLPWSHIEISTQGDVKPCCISFESMGSLENSSLGKIFYDSKFTQLRNDLLRGKQHSACNSCWRFEAQGMQSSRQRHLAFLGKQFYTEYLDNIAIRSIDLKPGNVCNFKCRICDPGNSSLFASEMLTHQPEQQSVVLQIIDRTRKFAEDFNIIKELSVLLPDIENIDIYGGEPFLLKQLPTLLDAIINSGRAPHIRLHFNTNGSVFNTELAHKLTYFKQVDIAVSIDNIGKRFELERGGVWETVEHNIKEFQTFSKFNVYIMPAVSIQNVYYLDELIAWAETLKIKITFNYVLDSDWADINYMTPAAKELVVNKFKDSTHPELQNIVKIILESPGSDGTVFVKKTKHFDTIRNQDFRLSHSAIAIAMGYVV